MKQIILSAEAVNPDPRPLDDLIAVLKGIMKAFGYSDVVAVLNVPDEEEVEK